MISAVAAGITICTASLCYLTQPWIMIEEAFGQAIGYEIRTELGCYMAAYAAHTQRGVNAYCAHDLAQAIEAFPQLKMEAPDAATNVEGKLPGIDPSDTGRDR